MPKRSDPSRNAEIVRNALAPKGFGRRWAVCVVAAPRRSQRHRLRRVALQPAQRRSERDPLEFFSPLLITP